MNSRHLGPPYKRRPIHVHVMFKHYSDVLKDHSEISFDYSDVFSNHSDIFYRCSQELPPSQLCISSHRFRSYAPGMAEPPRLTAFSLSLSLSLSLTHTHTHTRTLMHSRTQTLTLTHSHIHTLTHSHTDLFCGFLAEHREHDVGAGQDGQRRGPRAVQGAGEARRHNCGILQAAGGLQHDVGLRKSRAAPGR